MAFEMEKDPGWRYVRLSRDELQTLQSKPYDSKKNVWVPDKEEGFLAAEIKATKGDNVTVVTSKGSEVTVKKDLLQEMNPPKFALAEDMSNLSFLNDASVFGNLRDRFQQWLIYTYSGLFCVVINPFKRLPIYTESMAGLYMGKRKNEMPPHLWSNSDEAYRNMLQDHENQSMLITGESGAGKTENTKKVIAYFAFLGAAQAKAAGIVTEEGGKKKVSLEDQIVQTNPVLEAFGNAKTVRNNNSSRFGKFIRIHFSKEGRVAGCDIEHYLLEKSRVIRQAPGERAYHIFYQIQSGWNPDLKAQLELDKKPTDYWYCNQAETTIKGVDDKEEAGMADEAFDILNFSKEEKHNVYRICAALLHMGEMNFKDRQEQAEPDGEDEGKKCANQFGCDYAAFVNAMCKPRVKVGTEWVNKGQNSEQVVWGRGAMAKGIFARLFHWLVCMCNKTLDAQELERKYFCGVLDIAGFEIFDFNSFEQLWINFVNEKLQQFFNHHMFVLEQEEYQREGIVWAFIDFGMDLAACIELIEKPMGIISMLDEECVVPKGTDMSLAQKYIDTHVGKHPAIEKPKPPKGKQAEAHFALKHYAGLVRYNVTAWLEKNKDPLNDSVVSVLKSSTGNALVKTIWADYQTQEETAAIEKAGGTRKKGKSGSMMTVSMMYRESLNNLMSMLNATHPHFVRCLIPNEIKTGGILDAGLVMNQLTCNGVLEGIRICRKGFPNRMAHDDFKMRYSLLAAAEAKSSDDMKLVSTAILDRLCSEGSMIQDNFRVGHTKVFFKAGILASMEDLRDAKLGSILSKLQAVIRWNITLKDAAKRQREMSGFTVLQKNIRSWAFMRNWPWFQIWAWIRPQLKSGKMAEEMKKAKKRIEEIEALLEKDASKTKELEVVNNKLKEETNEMAARLAQGSSGMKEVEEKMNKLNDQKKALEKELAGLHERLSEQEDKNAEVNRVVKKSEAERENIKKTISDLEATLAKAEEDKAAKEAQIRSLQEEMHAQDEAVAKNNKEKKHQEEINRKLQEDLQAEEDKWRHLQKAQQKIQIQMDDKEDQLEREKRVRGDVEKAKRKVEADLKLAQEKIDEITRLKMDAESNLKKKEADLLAVVQRVEDEQTLVNKLQRQIKDLMARISELEEEVEAERSSRTKADRAKSDLQRELEELSERLDEAGGMTAAQVEVNKKREAELVKLRRDLEESNMNHENQLGALRKKHNDAVAEMGEQLDALQKSKAKMDKDRAATQREVDDLLAQVDQETKAKASYDKLIKQYELTLAELNAKADEQSRQLAEATSWKARITSENADLARQLEETEVSISQMQRSKGALNSQIDEAKRSSDEEARERQSLAAQCKNLQHELEQMRDQIDIEQESKNEALRQLSKSNAEIQGWKTKFESEALLKMEEMEDSKRKLVARMNDLQEQVDAANTKIAGLDKQRGRMMSELDDARLEVERALQHASTLEKRQKGFDKIIDEWKSKCDRAAADLEVSMRDSRNLSTEVFKMKTHNDEMNEQLEGLRRENKALAQEIKDLTTQLGEGGRSVMEMQKLVRRLEIEKDELQQALDEAEAALEAEESKVLRAQVEVSQIRQEIEKRIAEKEEEFENTRKNHQRAIDAMQSQLENETRGHADLTRVKKKLESDINELEISLDHANRSNADAQANLHRCQNQIRELQQHCELEQRHKDEVREQFMQNERRCTVAQQEKDELMTAADQSTRACKQAEYAAHESRDQASQLASENQSLNNSKRKLEADLQALHHDLDETLNELHASEDNAKKAMADAAKLAEELRQEQEHSMHIERTRKGLELQIKEMQARLDEAEAAALKGGKKVIVKLEQRIKDLENELDTEQRRHSDVQKSLAKLERRQRELEFQIEEDKKNHDRLTDLADKLQQKLKSSKKQVEDAEEVATVNLQKYRQLQHQLEDAEERADVAENGLAKIRAKNRSSASLAPGGLSQSRSTMFD